MVLSKCDWTLWHLFFLFSTARVWRKPTLAHSKRRRCWLSAIPMFAEDLSKCTKLFIPSRLSTRSGNCHDVMAHSQRTKLVIRVPSISKATVCKAISRTSNRFTRSTLSCLFSCHLLSCHISNLSSQLVLGLRFLNEHLPVPSEPLLHSLCDPSQHNWVDSWRWVGTMQDDSLDANIGVVVQLQSDG